MAFVTEFAKSADERGTPPAKQAHDMVCPGHRGVAFGVAGGKVLVASGAFPASHFDK